MTGAASVLTLGEGLLGPIAQLLARLDVVLRLVPDGEPIEGSYWGEPEAGLVGRVVHARPDTPVHSVLHETAHLLCMDEERRSRLYRDAGGDFAEENAVCYLQILLADEIPGIGAARLMQDMDAWGYTFRLGSARAWFESEAAEARGFLQARGLLGAGGQLVWHGCAA
jgi:hypothetical protein